MEPCHAGGGGSCTKKEGSRGDGIQVGAKGAKLSKGEWEPFQAGGKGAVSRSREDSSAEQDGWELSPLCSREGAVPSRGREPCQAVGAEKEGRELYRAVEVGGKKDGRELC